MKKLVVLSGAGVSAESGIKTFRDSDGLWENYRVEEVASIEGWYRNKALMLDFYNQRRRQLKDTVPNRAHEIIAELEKQFDVTVVTQNIDNLHERAGSTKIIHLHGELTKVRPEDREDSGIIDIGYKDVNLGDKDSRGKQLRPHIVWFGEAVPMLEKAAKAVSRADILLIIGTSLNVYPAAGLFRYVQYGTPIYLIDRADPARL
jgi:NAD-dependent protein deacetylases, SIR2 family